MSQLRMTPGPTATQSRRPRFIGMDEAGYGPNLGPLVICATVWETPDSPHLCDFYSLLAAAVTVQPDEGDSRLHIADSKQVYSPAAGLESLEKSALALLGAAGLFPSSWRELIMTLQGCSEGTRFAEPWYDGCDLTLPIACNRTEVGELTATFREALEHAGLELTQIRASVVEPVAFNGGLKTCGNKAEFLSKTAFRLLRAVWEPDLDQETLIVGDKHGGRNRYDLLLAEILDGAMVFRVEERRPLSRYRVGRTELRFQTNGEAHLPVAAGSIVAKYVREVSMELFNRFWLEHVPDLKPTKGYPGDSRRFRKDVRSKLKELGIKDSVFWRKR